LKYFLNATLNFVFSFLWIVRLHGKLEYFDARMKTR